MRNLNVKSVEITEYDEEQALAAIFGTAPFIPSDETTEIISAVFVHNMVRMFVAVDNMTAHRGQAESEVSA